MSEQKKRGRWDSSDSDTETRKVKDTKKKDKLVEKQTKSDKERDRDRVRERDRDKDRKRDKDRDRDRDRDRDGDRDRDERNRDIPRTSDRHNDSEINRDKEQTIVSSSSSSIAVAASAVVHSPPSCHNSFRPGRRQVPDRRCRSVDCYERLNFIDEGTYGMVFRAKCKQSGDIYAIKQVKPGPMVGKLGFPHVALREINALLSLKHPNIIPVREMVVGSGSDKMFMVMEFCENDVKTVMKLNQQSFSTAEIKRLMLQLLSAMAFIHSRGYLHRDLKTSNLLYSNSGKLYVCDFGLARKYETPAQPCTPEVVTLWYRCPELLLGCATYSTPLDMWSVGCIFAEFITGDPIFPGEGEMDQINKIFKVIGAPSEDKWPGFADLPHSGKLSWRLPSRGKLREMFPSTSFSGKLALSDYGVDLISKLLEMDPSKRYSAEQCESHIWLNRETPLPTSPELMPTFRSRSD